MTKNQIFIALFFQFVLMCVSFYLLKKINIKSRDKHNVYEKQMLSFECDFIRQKIKLVSNFNSGIDYDWVFKNKDVAFFLEEKNIDKFFNFIKFYQGKIDGFGEIRKFFYDPGFFLRKKLVLYSDKSKNYKSEIYEIYFFKDKNSAFFINISWNKKFKQEEKFWENRASGLLFFKNNCKGKMILKLTFPYDSNYFFYKVVSILERENLLSKNNKFFWENNKNDFFFLIKNSGDKKIYKLINRIETAEVTSSLFVFSGEVFSEFFEEDYFLINYVNYKKNEFPNFYSWKYIENFRDDYLRDLNEFRNFFDEKNSIKEKKIKFFLSDKIYELIQIDFYETVYRKGKKFINYFSAGDNFEYLIDYYFDMYTKKSFVKKNFFLECTLKKFLQIDEKKINFNIFLTFNKGYYNNFFSLDYLGKIEQKATKIKQQKIKLGIKITEKITPKKIELIEKIKPDFIFLAEEIFSDMHDNDIWTNSQIIFNFYEKTSVRIILEKISKKTDKERINFIEKKYKALILQK